MSTLYTPTEITPARQEPHPLLPTRRYPARWDFDTDETYAERQALYRAKWAQALEWWLQHTRQCMALGLMLGGPGWARLLAVEEARDLLQFEEAMAGKRDERGER